MTKTKNDCRNARKGAQKIKIVLQSHFQSFLQSLERQEAFYGLHILSDWSRIPATR